MKTDFDILLEDLACYKTIAYLEEIRLRKLQEEIPKDGEWTDVKLVKLEIGKNYIVRRNWGSKKGPSKNEQDIDAPGISRWTDRGWVHAFGKEITTATGSFATLEVLVPHKH